MLRNMMLLCAAGPVIVVIATLALRFSPLAAASAGCLVAAVTSAVFFPIPEGTLAVEWVDWTLLLGEVLAIIAGGLLLSHLMKATGRQDLIAGWLKQSLGSGVPAVLAVVHGVTPFAESLTGFGIGVTISIPLLIHLGLDSRRAATTGLLGLCAVPWGSMGPGTLIAADLAGVDFRSLGIASALASGPIFIVVGGVAACLVAEPLRRARAVAAGALSGLVLTSMILLMNLLFSTAPAGALGALLTFGAHLAIHRLRGRRMAVLRGMGGATAGYVVLLGGVLALTVSVGWAMPDPGPARLLASPALWLFIASGVILERRSLLYVARSTWKAWTRVAPVTGLFIALGIVMAASGMSDHLARGAGALGDVYPFVLPGIAGLGGYLTGSNSGANAMLAAPQSAIAANLGLPMLTTIAVHNVSAALFLMSSPAKIALAAHLTPDPTCVRKVQSTVLVTTCSLAVAFGLMLGMWA